MIRLRPACGAGRCRPDGPSPADAGTAITHPASITRWFAEALGEP